MGILGVFGFDRIELGTKERVEELPGLVKRQNNLNGTEYGHGEYAAAAA